jgi:hypothetical protein
MPPRSSSPFGSAAAALIALGLIGTVADGSGRRAERFDLSPKNSGPDHAVPVIFLAIADSER